MPKKSVPEPPPTPPPVKDPGVVPSSLTQTPQFKHPKELSTALKQLPPQEQLPFLRNVLLPEESITLIPHADALIEILSALSKKPRSDFFKKIEKLDALQSLLKSRINTSYELARILNAVETELWIDLSRDLNQSDVLKRLKDSYEFEIVLSELKNKENIMIFLETLPDEILPAIAETQESLLQAMTTLPAQLKMQSIKKILSLYKTLQDPGTLLKILGSLTPEEQIDLLETLNETQLKLLIQNQENLKLLIKNLSKNLILILLKKQINTLALENPMSALQLLFETTSFFSETLQPEIFELLTETTLPELTLETITLNLKSNLKLFSNEIQLKLKRYLKENELYFKYTPEHNQTKTPEEKFLLAKKILEKTIGTGWLSQLLCWIVHLFSGTRSMRNAILEITQDTSINTIDSLLDQLSNAPNNKQFDEKNKLKINQYTLSIAKLNQKSLNALESITEKITQANTDEETAKPQSVFGFTPEETITESLRASIKPLDLAGFYHRLEL